MPGALAGFVTELDMCWLERRFDDLAAYLAEDVSFALSAGHRIEGRDAAIGSYRQFMTRGTVERFETSDVKVSTRADAAVVEYQWDMSWSDAATAHSAKGREVLVLARGDEGWRVFWRTQLPG